MLHLQTVRASCMVVSGIVLVRQMPTISTLLPTTRTPCETLKAMQDGAVHGARNSIAVIRSITMPSITICHPRVSISRSQVERRPSPTHITLMCIRLGMSMRKCTRKPLTRSTMQNRPCKRSSMQNLLSLTTTRRGVSIESGRIARTIIRLLTR